MGIKINIKMHSIIIMIEIEWNKKELEDIQFKAALFTVVNKNNDPTIFLPEHDITCWG